MLQINLIRQKKDIVIEALRKRSAHNFSEVINQVLNIDDQRKETQASLDDLLARSNALSREIGEFMQAGEIDKAQALKKDTSSIKEESKKFSAKLNMLEKELEDLLTTIPNLPNQLVPAGKNSEDNEIIFEEPFKVDIPENALPHWELAKKYNIIDFELGNKITGAGFPVYKGKGARLQRCLINFFLEEAAAAGYYEIQPPVIVNEHSAFATGQLPDKEGQMYKLAEDSLYLIPTAEVPITNLYRDTILDSEQLPVKNAGYSLCFRREAGSWGAHVRGLNRLHQFDKVEIVQITKPENSYQALDEMVNHVKGLLEKLKLPYRLVRLCGGDLGFTSALTYDFEVFSSAQKKWLEVSSVSNFETYQANRLKLRYKDKSGKMILLHTLNGSALALPRIMAALLENNQNSEGITLPEIIAAKTGFDKIS